MHLVFLFLLAFLLSSSNGWAEPYRVSNGLFQMDVPSDWEPLEKSRNRIGMLTVLSPERSNGINIHFQKEPDLVHDQIPEKIQGAMNAMAAALKEEYSSPVLEQEAVLFAGVPSGKIRFHTNGGNEKTEGVQMIVLHKDHRISITYISTNPDEFKQMDEIVETFTFDTSGKARSQEEKNPLELKEFNRVEEKDIMIYQGEIKNTGTETVKRSILKLVFEKPTGETILSKEIPVGQMWAHEYKSFSFELSPEDRETLTPHLATYKAKLGVAPVEMMEADNARWFMVKRSAASDVPGYHQYNEAAVEVSAAEVV